jgi:hypothetical protein
MHVRILMMITMLAGGLTAQTSANVNGSVPDNFVHLFKLVVDHGASATTVDVMVSINTTGTSGLSVGLLDLDEWAVLSGAGFSEGDFVSGAGTVMFTLALPSRAGVHELILSVETNDIGPASPYTGTATVSAGTIVQGGFVAHPYEFAGTRVTFGRVIEYYREFSGSGVVTMDFVLDYGPAAHTTVFAANLGAGAVTQLRLLDMGAMPPAELLVEPAVGSTAFSTASHTTASHTGKVPFRFEVTRNGGTGGAQAFFVLSADVTLDSVTDSLTPRGGGGGKKGNDCAVGAGGPAGAMPAALMCLWALVRSKRA